MCGATFAERIHDRQNAYGRLEKPLSMNTTKRRGGPRPGSGRPAGPETVTLAVRVLPETADYIRRNAALAGVSYGAYVDCVVERARLPQTRIEKRLKKSFDG